MKKYFPIFLIFLSVISYAAVTSSRDNTKVKKTGDSMSGDLLMDGAGNIYLYGNKLITTNLRFRQIDATHFTIENSTGGHYLGLTLESLDATKTVTGTNITDLLNSTTSLKVEIDNINSSVIEYFLTTSTDGSSGYRLMTTTGQAQAAAHENANVGIDTTVISTWTTLSGYPNKTYIKGGVWEFHIRASKTSSTKVVNIYYEVYKKAAAGAETFLFTSPNSEALTTSPVDLEIFCSTVSITLLATDRIVIYMKAALSGSGTTPVISAEYGGGIYGDADFPAQPAINAVNNPVMENIDFANHDISDVYKIGVTSNVSVPQIDVTNKITVSSITMTDGSPVGGGTTVKTTTETISLLGGYDVYQASGSFAPIPSAFYVAADTVYVTGVFAYNLYTSTVSSTWYQIALTTETGNATVWSYQLSKDGVEVSTNSKFSSTNPASIFKSEIFTVNIGNTVALHSFRVPSIGAMPSEYGITLRIWRYLKQE